MEKINLRTTLVAGSAIIFLAAFLRLYGVGGQPPIPDELGVALSAVNYVENGQFGPTMWFHPNLRNVVQYGVGKLFGHGPYALRWVSLMTGILSIPLLGLLCHELTGKRMVSLLAAYLLAVEQVHITFSRQAIQETWTTFLFLLGTLLFIYFRRAEKPWLLILSGVAFGLGTASKFHALFPLFICFTAGIYHAWERRSFPRAIFVFSSMVVVPATVYLLTYIPWFGRGYGVLDWFFMQKAVFWQMATHKGFQFDQMFDNAAWEWFLRPLGYANFVLIGDKPWLTVAYSNPVVWLLVIPATVTLLWGAFRRVYSGAESKGVIFILSLFAISYLPLAFSSRPIWLLSSLATIPFAFMVLALAIDRWVDAVKRGKGVLLAVYVATVLASSLLIYPMATGEGKSYGYLHSLVEKYRPAFESR